jgi:hypothetical protein
MNEEQIIEFIEGVNFPIEYPEQLDVEFNDGAIETHDPVFEINIDRSGIAHAISLNQGAHSYAYEIHRIKGLSINPREDYIREQEALSQEAGL